MDSNTTVNGTDVAVPSQQLDVSITFILETIFQGVGQWSLVTVVHDAAISTDAQVYILEVYPGRVI